MKRISVILFLAAVSLNFGFAQNSTFGSKAEKIGDLVKLYNVYGKFNGSILVAEHGRVIFSKGYGYANQEWNIPNGPATKFRIGSITKQFTSMLVMQLVREGKINLDGKVTDYIADYPREKGDRITIRHLLTHTSGIPNYTSFPSFQDLQNSTTTPKQFIPVFADSALQFTPGTRYSYSNSGYFLLGCIIEKAAGKPYEEVLKERILEPLQLKNTGYDHPAAIEPERASGYMKLGLEYSNAPYINMSVPYAAGAMYSTVEDLFSWDQALYTDKLIPASLRTIMFTPTIDNYAFGWEVRKTQIGNTTDSVLCIQHGGSINGFTALICRIPQDKNLIVILSNSNAVPIGDISRNIKAIIYEKLYDRPKMSVADAVLSEIGTKGAESVRTVFKNLMDREFATYELNEVEMNQAGYSLLAAHKIAEAIEVFKLNVEAFPSSSNVYNSLGEAYMMHGDTELAIENYKKSLELDHNNTNAIQKLKELETK